MRDPLETPKAHSSIVIIQKQSNPMQRPFLHILNYGQEAGGQKLIIFHPHRKKKKWFFRINNDSSITCQVVCTDSHNLVGGVGHIHLSVLPPRSGRPELPTPQESLHPGLSEQAMAAISERLILWVVIVWVRTLSTGERAKIRSACGIFTSWEVEAVYTMNLFIFFPPKIQEMNTKRSSNRCFYEEQHLYRYIYHIETPQTM